MEYQFEKMSIFDISFILLLIKVLTRCIERVSLYGEGVALYGEGVVVILFATFVVCMEMVSLY